MTINVKFGLAHCIGIVKGQIIVGQFFQNRVNVFSVSQYFAESQQRNNYVTQRILIKETVKNRSKFDRSFGCALDPYHNQYPSPIVALWQYIKYL